MLPRTPPEMGAAAVDAGAQKLREAIEDRDSWSPTSTGRGYPPRGGRSGCSPLRPASSPSSDRPSSRQIPLLLLLASVFSVPVAFAPSLGWFIVLIVIATFFLGGIEPLLQAEISALAPPRRRGFIFGIRTTVRNVGWFAAPLVVAAMIIAGMLHAWRTRRAA